ncbi:transposase [Sinorhizobium sp. 8-89]|uniref:transposase n=1 Tax=Sinorhizobium sp. 7-81 TaxID=3049087 RepID=UPI0024C38B1F|nr:transposase [Sinorhizobium sp. 7-81]MDK1389325.1 transposase [Sinorhizobium sp. 7-81]
MARDGEMDVHVDVSNGGFAGRLDVIEGPTGRRRRTDAEKARIAAESLIAGSAVSELARRYGTTRWQIYDWRKRLRDGRLGLGDTAPTAPFAALVVEEPPLQRGSAAVVEDVVGDVVIRAGRGADEDHVARVIRAVRSA